MAKQVLELTPDKLDELSELANRDVEIKSAKLNDALCNYTYELLSGKTSGDEVTRKGKHIVHEDLEKAFSKFNVFLAHLDDAYTGNDNSTELSYLEEEPETEKYHVNSLKITGVEENKALIISGTKVVDNGVISFDAPKVKLNGNYLYLIPLKDRLATAILEVEEYMNGKSAPQEDLNQTSMEFEGDEETFEDAKIEEEVE